MATPGHKILIEILTDANGSDVESAAVTWGDVTRLIQNNIPHYAPVVVKPLSADIHSRGMCGTISITVEELPE